MTEGTPGDSPRYVRWRTVPHARMQHCAGMNPTPLHGLFVIIAALAATPTAGAGPLFIGGTFSGIASVRQLPLNFTPPHPMSYYEGATVTGSFEVFAPNPQPVSFSDSSFYNLGGWLSLSYTVSGETFTYLKESTRPPGSPSILILSPSGAGHALQSVFFATDWTTRYDGASIELSGMPGSLFEGIDVATLHFDPSQPLSMHTGMSSSAAEMRMDVDVRQFTVRSLNAVPEPAPAALLVLGLALLCASRWRVSRTGNPESKAPLQPLPAAAQSHADRGA